MSKVIAVWGSPGCGKTTFATKLAMALYEKYVMKIIVIYADIETPALELVAPDDRDRMHSLGELLSKPRITTEDVLLNMLTFKKRDNLGMLGYMSGDNRNTYPAYDGYQINSLFEVLKSMADIVIVDCTSGLHDELSEVAMKTADTVFRLVAPSLKSLEFMNSQLPLISQPEYRSDKHVVVINNNVSANAPVEETKVQLGKVDFEMPFLKSMRKQNADTGNYLQRPNKVMIKSYQEVMDKVV